MATNAIYLCLMCSSFLRVFFYSSVSRPDECRVKYFLINILQDMWLVVISCTCLGLFGVFGLGFLGS